MFMSGGASERSEFAEFFEAGVDFFASQGAEAVHAEFFAAETSHDGAVDDSSAEVAAAEVAGFEVEALGREIAEESARETVACACGVENVFEKVARHDEEGIAAEEHRSVFSAFNDESMGANIEDLRSRFLQVGFAREHFGFAVVDEQEIPIADCRQKFIAEIFDPEVHGVAAGEANAVHLGSDAALQGGLDVSEQQVFFRTVAFREFRIEGGEDVQLSRQRFAIVHVG